MKKSFGIFAIILLLIAGWTQRQALGNFVERFSNGDISLADIHLPEEIFNNLAEEDVLPPPLRGESNADRTTLTIGGVVQWTNEHRTLQRLKPLRQNAKLQQAANLKLQDMFANQYFEHVSPSGVKPSDLADRVSYEYVVVGENLALGNFGTDEKLVEGWMNSPGHRANILNARYQEIGVAVGKGMYEGRETWLAVQSFGTPLSSCPSPNPELKTQIANNQATLRTMERELDARRQDIEQTSDREEHNAKVAEYNAQVQRFNELLATTKNQVARYNAEVNAFNECLKGT